MHLDLKRSDADRSQSDDGSVRATCFLDQLVLMGGLDLEFEPNGKSPPNHQTSLTSRKPTI